MKKKEPISLRAYARHRQVSLTAVQKAIDDGRLKECVVLVKGVRKIADATLADREWDENTSYISPDSTSKDNPSARKYQDARAVREQFQAAIAKLEYEEKIGRKVDSNKVQVAAFNAARKARDMIMSIADRIAPLYPEIEHELHLNITEECERVCRELANFKGY